MSIYSEHITETSIKISHSDLSISMNYDEQIDEYDATDFLKHLDSVSKTLLSKLPIKNGKPFPDLQICSNFFIECKDMFPGIPAMLIFDELTETLEISPNLMFNNLAKKIQKRLVKELKAKISLDKYNKHAQKEFVERNGAIQPSFVSKSHISTI